MTNQEKVLEFSTATGGFPPFKLHSKFHQLKVLLVQEEYHEWAEAIENEGETTFEFMTENVLKEMADMLYVLYGYAAYRGWDLDEAFNRVHQSNMSKLGPDGKAIFREDGKVLKGPNYKPPYLGDLTERKIS